MQARHCKEILTAVTVNEAQALGNGHQAGWLGPEMAASVVLLHVGGQNHYQALNSRETCRPQPRSLEDGYCYCVR